jgi:hypothetical protein
MVFVRKLLLEKGGGLVGRAYLQGIAVLPEGKLQEQQQ